MTLKTGSLVYRVVEVDPDEGPSTWKVACVVVEQASARQIKLKTYFPGLWRNKFKPDVLGSIFFETPLQAIQYFDLKQRLEIGALDRKRQDAERAIAWANSQEGMSP